MDTGTGIMLAGVWIFAGLVISSKTMSEMASWIAILSAALLTINQVWG